MGFLSNLIVGVLAGALAIVTFGASLAIAAAIALAATAASYALDRLLSGQQPTISPTPFQTKFTQRTALDNFIPVVMGAAYVAGIQVHSEAYGANTTNSVYALCCVSTGAAPYTFPEIYLENYQVTTDVNNYVNGATDPAGNSVSDYNNKVSVKPFTGPTTFSSSFFPTWRALNGPLSSSNPPRMSLDCGALISVATTDKVAAGTVLTNLKFKVVNSKNDPAYWINDLLTNTRYGCGLPASLIDSAGLAIHNGYAARQLNYINPSTGLQSIANAYYINGLVTSNNNSLVNAKDVAKSSGGILKFSNVKGLYSVWTSKPYANYFLLYSLANTGATSITLTGNQTASFPNGTIFYAAGYTIAYTVSSSSLTSGNTVLTFSPALNIGIIAGGLIYTNATIYAFNDDNIVRNNIVWSLSRIPTAVDVTYYDGQSTNKGQSLTLRVSVPSLPINTPDYIEKLTFPFCNTPLQATRLATLYLNTKRRSKTIQFTADQRSLGLEAGDVVSVTNSVLGLSNNLFLIQSIRGTMQGEGQIRLDITANEYNAIDYVDAVVTWSENNYRTTTSSLRSISNYTPVAPSQVNSTGNIDLGGLQISAPIPSFLVSSVIFRYKLSTDANYTYLDALNSPESSGTFTVGTNVISTFPKLMYGSYQVSYKLINGFYSSNWSTDFTLNWNPTAIQFVSQYIIIRYGTNAAGAGFSTNPLNATYVGFYNSVNSSAPGLASFYTWYPLGSTLSSMNHIYFWNQGSRTLTFKTGSSNPNVSQYTDFYNPPNPSNPILDLDSNTGFYVSQAYTAGGGNFLTSVQNADGSITFLLPNGTSVPGTTNLSDIAALNIDNQGRISGFTSSDKIYFTQSTFSATGANQTFAFTHIVGQALIFLNGILLDTTEYTETASGFTIPSSFNGATVFAVRFTESDSTGTTSYVPFTRTTLTSVAGQSLYNVSNFNQGSELLFINGVFINDPDYSYPSPNQLQLTNPTSFSGNNIILIQFRILNNNAVPFGQAIGQTSTLSGLTPVSGTLNTTSTIVAKNGVFLTIASDFTLSTGNVNLLTTPIFSGEVIESTSWASSGPA